MSTTALRAIVLSVNLVLIGLVVWTSYLTFFHVDPVEWEVQPPDFERFRPPPAEDDPLRADQKAYDRIHEVFDKAPPKPKPIEQPKPEPQGPPKTPLEQLVVVMSVVSDSPEMRSSVMLKIGRGQEKPFTEGMSLDAYDDFRSFKGVTIQKIGREEVVLFRDGKEVHRLSAKPKGGGS